MYANIMIPSNEITDFSEGEVPRIYESSMDAITRGTRDGVDIAVNVGAILVVFIALVYLVDSVLGLLPSIAGREVSLQMILGFIFYPIVWLMGVPLDEVMTSAELLGIKTALNEGGQCDGPPGLRDHTPNYYGAYVKDLDGNKIHIYKII